MNKFILIAISFLVGLTTCDAQEFIGIKKTFTTSEEVDDARKKIHLDWFGPVIEEDPILIGELGLNTVYYEIDYKLEDVINKGFLSITNGNLNTKNRTIDQIIKSDTDWYFEAMESKKSDRLIDYIRTSIVQAGYYFDTSVPFINIYFLNNKTKEIVFANVEILGTKEEKIAFAKDFIKKYVNVKWKKKI